MPVFGKMQCGIGFPKTARTLLRFPVLFNFWSRFKVKPTPLPFPTTQDARGTVKFRCCTIFSLFTKPKNKTMKLNLNLIHLATLAAITPQIIEAAQSNLALCSAQAECIDFTIKKRDSSSCAVTGNCAIEVCMILDTDKEGCSKEGPISHLCAANDADGCAAYDADGVTPLTGKGDSSDCDLTGDDGTAAFDGKCEPSSNKVVMCQEAEPGQTVYWALKDSNVQDTGVYDYTGSFTFTADDSSTCSPTIECYGGTTDGIQCADPANGMYDATRVWKYTIPSSGSCDLCGSSDLEPTAGPTSGPTTLPTGGPTSVPVAPPTPAIQPTQPTNPPTSDAGSQGDPHFKTWKNEHFEYHGQCDLVLANDPNFADGLGLDVQIRTKMVRYWSYIKSVAIRIGDDIFEVQGKADNSEDLPYWINMESGGAVKTVGGFPVIFKSQHNRKARKQTVSIDLGSKYPGSVIEIQIWKEFVKVNFQNPTVEAFGNTVGMLGNFHNEKTVGRDGATVFDDFILFGNEWQVLPADGMLFHNTEQPQFPSKCIEPEDPQGQRRRRLEESSVSIEEAEKACASLTDELDRKDCVYDIIATQDLEMVGAY